MAEERGEIPPPYALAIMVCEGTYRDPQTGKRIVIGCFSGIAAHEFPAMQPTMVVYAELTNGRGAAKIRIQLVDVDEEREPICTVELEADFSDVRAVVEVQCDMGATIFPEPGEYRIQVFANDKFVIERGIVAQQVP